jgi:phosphomannomutase
VFLKLGYKVYYYPDLVHTPLVPFGVTYFGASCGIMITASHNPKQDNGYKLYWNNGCQIIPPHDSKIANLILQNLEPITWDYDLVKTSPLVQDPSSIIPEYFKKLSSYSSFKDSNPQQNVKFCYTAMHGVGLDYARRAFEAFHLKPFVPVPLQADPDPEFPTVAFPNPEEGKGALKLAMETASGNNCSIILANDPDADRLAIAEFQVGTNEWHIFTGNQIGALLGSFVLESLKEKQIRKAVLTTTVSSHMIAEIAKDFDAYFDETLTGFKWLGNRAIDLQSEGYETVFAYEEAIGFMCYDLVRDKDGVSALAIFAEWANHLYSKGLTVYGHLQSLYDRYGYWVSNNAYFICHEKIVINRIFDKIRYGSVPREIPGQTGFALDYPKSIAGFKVVYVRDLTVGYDSSTPDHRPTLPVSSSSQMLTLQLENSCVLTLRTSGTEPKIKYYTEYKGSSFESGTKELQVIVDAMIADLLEPEFNNLK